MKSTVGKPCDLNHAVSLLCMVSSSVLFFLFSFQHIPSWCLSTQLSPAATLAALFMAAPQVMASTTMMLCASPATKATPWRDPLLLNARQTASGAISLRHAEVRSLPRSACRIYKYPPVGKHLGTRGTHLHFDSWTVRSPPYLLLAINTLFLDVKETRLKLKTYLRGFE